MYHSLDNSNLKFKKKRERAHGHGQQCGDCGGWFSRGGRGHRGIEGLKRNGKNKIIN